MDFKPLLQLFDALAPKSTSIDQLKEESTEHYAKVIQAVLDDLKMELKPEELSDSSCLWTYKHGSAALQIRLHRENSEKYLVFEVLAPLVKLPKDEIKADDRIVALMTLCMDLNCHLSDAHLAWSENLGIVLTSRRRAVGLDAEEVLTTLRTVSIKADRMDDLLSRDFGAMMWGVAEA